VAASVYAAVGIEWVVYDVNRRIELERRTRKRVVELALKKCT
jgi:hypothetical protein